MRIKARRIAREKLEDALLHGWLKESDVRDGIRALGYTEHETNIFVERVIERIAQVRRLSNLHPPKNGGPTEQKGHP